MGSFVRKGCSLSHLPGTFILRVFLLLPPCVSVSLFILARLVSRLVMDAGSCTVLNTAYSRTDRCPQTKPSEAVTTPSTPSSARPELASTCPGQCLLISNPP